MNPTLIEYLGFVVAALIIAWASIEICRRYFRQRKVESNSPNSWLKLDSTFEGDIDKALPDEESDEKEEHVSKASIHIRAQHNGYHSESKKLF